MVGHINHRRQPVLARRMSHLVMIFGIDDSSKHIACHFLFQRALDGENIAIRIVDLRDNTAHGVHHRVIPLAIKFQPSRAGLERDVS